MNNKSGLYVLLAAGFSRRFGSPKLLHKLPSGKSIINTSIDALTQSGCEFAVAIRNDDQCLANHLSELNVNAIAVSGAEKGLSSVIAETTSIVNQETRRWMGICLADMPYIQPKTFTNLASLASPNGIVRPRYQGVVGHPVIFGEVYFDALKHLVGDDGAKSIIKQNIAALTAIDVDDPMVLYDIDTPEQIR